MQSIQFHGGWKTGAKPTKWNDKSQNVLSRPNTPPRKTGSRKGDRQSGYDRIEQALRLGTKPTKDSPCGRKSCDKPGVCHIRKNGLHYGTNDPGTTHFLAQSPRGIPKHRNLSAKTPCDARRNHRGTRRTMETLYKGELHRSGQASDDRKWTTLGNSHSLVPPCTTSHRRMVERQTGCGNDGTKQKIGVKGNLYK